MSRRSGASSSTRAILVCVVGMLAGAGALTSGGAGCAWDWSVRDDGSSATDGAADGSAGKDATTADATRDANDGNEDSGDDDANTLDASPAASDGSNGADASAVDAAPSCSTLAGEADAARVSARACTLGNMAECMASVKDLCDCTVFVTDTSSASSKHFADLSAQLKASGCTNDCAGCAVSPVRGTCLDTVSGVAACYP